MRKQGFLWRFSRRWCSALALLSVLALLGMMPPSLLNSEQPSKNSGRRLSEWEALSEKFGWTLRQHELTLIELSSKLETSEANGQKLTGLLEELSTQNTALRTYNIQIGDRMQERDEDLASAYYKLDRTEERFRNTLIAAVLMGVLILGSVVLKILRIAKVIPV